MEVKVNGNKVAEVIFEEDNESENSVNIYWKDGKKTRCILIEQL